MSSVPEPVRSRAALSASVAVVCSVPLMATSLAVAPSAASEAIESVPPDTVTLPAKVLVPPRTNAPASVLARPLEPVIAEPIVAEAPGATAIAFEVAPKAIAPPDTV